jgi:response regulator RpfG family c-di-GMP phosphodiesterase
MNSEIKILIVDDEKVVLTGLKKLINLRFPEIQVLLALNGEDALNKIHNDSPDLVLTDIIMPGNISGLNLLETIRSDEALNNIYFIAMTGNSVESHQAEALSRGADDFLSKPFNQEFLVSRLKTGLRIINLQKNVIEDNKKLKHLTESLEKDFQDMILLSSRFLQARMPATADMMQRAAKAAVWIANSYGEYSDEEIKDLEIAAYLSLAGRIFLPDELLDTPVMESGRPTHALMHQVPKAGKDIVSTIERFKNVGKIIQHIYENFDGSGIPDRLQSWQIPFESRIIRVCIDYEEIRYKTRKSRNRVLEMLKNEAKRLYDQRVVILFEHFAKTYDRMDDDPDEIAVQLAQLKEGMVVTRDITTEKGQKLLPAGASLTGRLIERIISHNTIDPILGNIYIKAN